MITPEQIQNTIAGTIAGSEIVVVEIAVRSGNKILVYADAPKGISIDECVMISRCIEQSLNRDIEDFELEVSSPGLSQPFKVIQQYKKNIGRQIEVILKEGDKLYGTLIWAENESFTVETKEKIKTLGKKKSELITEQHKISLADIKSTKVVLSF